LVQILEADISQSFPVKGKSLFGREGGVARLKVGRDIDGRGKARKNNGGVGGKRR